MTKDKREPLVMVVDDVPQYGEDQLPRMVEAMGCRVCKAATVEQAIQKAAEHGPETLDPLNLAIIDMHLPYDSASLVAQDTDKAGGIHCLEAIRYLKLCGCPCVVYTAFPTFDDCVQAVHAGAAAYIPKKRIGEEGGAAALYKVSEGLLHGGTPRKEPVPSGEWMERNYEWLRQGFAGKWVAIVKNGVASDAKPPIPGVCERDGLAVFCADSYEALRDIIAGRKALVMELPAVGRIPRESESAR
jgi:ActR/RegA family two-component response regulator